MLKVLSRGSSGKLVEAVQAFLRGRGMGITLIDGKYGPNTQTAVQNYQKAVGLDATGSVDAATWASMLAAGIDNNAVLKQTEDFPPKPLSLKPYNAAERDRVFGPLVFQAAPTLADPEAVRITNDWAKKNLVTVEVPQLAQVKAGKPSTKQLVHKKAADAFVALWAAWEAEGLLRGVRSWAGLWAPRFIRGSRTVLSNHAYATAFDINASWNGLGAKPAAVGAVGSVRELVPIANEHGWYWGGHFSRPDGMHFEYARG